MDAVAAARVRAGLERAAEQGGALAHADQPVAAGAVARGRAAVVSDVDLERVRRRS